MIARIWNGAVRREDGDEYARYMACGTLSTRSRHSRERSRRKLFYPEDDRFLIERDLSAAHCEVHTAVGLPLLIRRAGGVFPAARQQAR